MALDTEFYSIADVLEYYNDSPDEICYYRLYVSDPKKDIIFGQGNTEEELLKDLHRIYKNNMNRNKYFISIYGEDQKKPFKSSSFQLHTRDRYVGGIKEELEELTEEEEEIEEENYTDSIIGYIKAAFPPREISNIVLTFIQNYLNKNSMSATNNSANIPNALAGIPEQEEIAILYSLMSKGVTLDHLRKLNSMDQIKLSSLLLML